MVIFGSYMFGFSVSKDINYKNNAKRKIPIYLLAYFLIVIVNKLKFRIEHGKLVTTLNIIKH